MAQPVSTAKASLLSAIFTPPVPSHQTPSLVTTFSHSNTQLKRETEKLSPPSPSYPTRSFSSASSSSRYSRKMGTPEPLRTDYPFSNAHSSSPRSLESGIRRFAQPKARSGIRGLLSRMFTRSSQQDLDIPIQECPGMSGTSSELEEPSRLKKRNVPPCHCLDKQRKRKRQLFLIILIIILLYLLGNMVAVNIQVFSTRSSSNGHSLSAVQSLCLAEFTVNAAVNASTYPCSSCLPVLQTISEGASFLSQEDRSTLQNSLQFCGLQSLVIASGASSQASFINGGWIQDTSFCSWSGVGCDGEGRVSSL